MRYLSLCSGIEAATVAWHPLGWEPVAFSEIDPFPCAVLAHHYPDVPNWGDMTKFKEWPDATVDILVGGTPCQSFSVAGLRAGLDDPRGNLALVYLAVADRYRPKWLVWENVPGVLSSDEGRAMGSILGAMAKLGYGFAYRVLDAYHFGTPMRNRRVFVLGHSSGRWQYPAAVLFDGETVGELRKKAPGIPRIDASGLAKKQTMPERGRCWTVHDGRGHRFLTPEECELLMGFPYGYTNIKSKARGKRSREQAALEPENKVRNHPGGIRADAGGAEQSVRGMRLPDGAPGDRPRPCNREGERDTVPPMQHPASGGRGRGLDDAGDGVSVPRVADGPRYNALGNSMATNCMRWLGRRIQMVEDVMEKAA